MSFYYLSTVFGLTSVLGTAVVIIHRQWLFIIMGGRAARSLLADLSSEPMMICLMMCWK
jgi:hypothetical protein